MHSYHVSHGYKHRYPDLLQSDIKYNIMRDGTHLSLSPIHACHAWKQREGVTWAHFFSRPVRPVKYHLIDAGHSKVYDSSIPLEATLDYASAGDPAIPEYVIHSRLTSIVWTT